MTRPKRQLLLLALGVGCSSDFQVAQGSAQLDISPSLSDLGGVAVGDSVAFDLDLVASSGEVQVTGVDVLNVEGDWFTLETTDLPLVGDGETKTLSLAYAPEDEGYHWAQVTVETDESSGALHVVTVRGMAAEPDARVYPLVVDFGPVRAGSAGTGWFVVANESHVPLVIDDIRVDNNEFRVASPFPVTVAAASEQVISVGFEPDDESEQSSSLVLDTSGVLELSIVTLRGNACSTAGGALYDWDADGFGFCGSDCDDWDDDVHPGATEICDGVDEDCDGEIDEGTTCSDDDGDGYTEEDGDCNDGDGDVSPGHVEVSSNGVDDDCDGVTDDGTGDSDGDGYALSAGDCDDEDDDVFPGAPEVADGKDNDCDGDTDEGTEASDDDGDGYSEDAGDCDDTEPATYPGASESADWMDNDCDGTTDEGTRYYDDDGDGYTEKGDDCDDSDPDVNPGEVEIEGDDIDNDCDGTTK